MSRLEAFLGASIMVLATVLVTEWVHYRVGNSSLFEVLLGPAGGISALSGGRQDPDAVTEAAFQSYLRVLEAMQADRSLSIEAAVAAERMPLARFRELEQRIQRNDGLVDRARHTLRERAESLWKARVAPLQHG